MKGERTVRLLNAWMFGLVAEGVLNSLPLAASEGFETNCWGVEGAILEDKKDESWGKSGIGMS
jgi:hypothetical protein